MQKSEKVNNATFLPKELLVFKEKFEKEWVIKSLLTLAALIAGVCAIILLGSSFFSYSITIVLVSSLAIYQYFYHYRKKSSPLE